MLFFSCFQNKALDDNNVNCLQFKISLILSKIYVIYVHSILVNIIG